MDWSSFFRSDQGCSAFAEKVTGQCPPYTLMDKHQAKMNIGTAPEQFPEQPGHRDSAHTATRQHLTESRNVSAFSHLAVLVRKISVAVYSHYKVTKLANKYTAPI